MSTEIEIATIPVDVELTYRIRGFGEDPEKVYPLGMVGVDLPVTIEPSTLPRFDELGKPYVTIYPRIEPGKLQQLAARKIATWLEEGGE